MISDIAKHSLSKVDEEGKFLCSMGDFVQPGYIAIDDEDNIIVPDYLNDCLYIFDADGKLRQKIGSSGCGNGQLKEPWGVATDGENILVSEGKNNRVQIFHYDGTFVSIIDSSGDPLHEPRGLAVTKDGYVYVADRDNHCIKKYRYKNMPQSQH